MTFNEYTQLEDPLTRGQALGILLVRMFVSLSSIMGSSLIIFFILRHKLYKERDSFHRLMLGVSGADIVVSIWSLTVNFCFPKEVGFHFTYGNVGTCTFSGFLVHVGVLSGILYNAGLSSNFAASCVGDWSKDKIVMLVENPTHFLAIVLPLVGSLVEACFKFFNTNTGFRMCAHNSEPHNCQTHPEIHCVRGRYDKYLPISDLMYYFFLLLVIVGTFIALVNLMVVTVVAHRRIQAGVQHHMESSNLKKRLQKLRHRTIWYGASQINTTIWAACMSFMTSLSTDISLQKDLYPFLIVSHAMMSIQGTLNAIIFFHLRFEKVQKLFPAAGILTWFHLVMGGEEAQKSYKLKMRSQERNNSNVNSATCLSMAGSEMRNNTQNQDQTSEDPDLVIEENFDSEHSLENARQ